MTDPAEPKHYDPPTPDDKGRIPLFYVVARSFEEPERIARYIHVKKNDPNATDNNLDTPLHWAVWNRRLVAARALLENGADPTIANYKGDTALHHLFSRPIESRVSVQMLELLLDAGADPAITNHAGRSGYHELACCHVRDLACASKMVEILTQRFGSTGWSLKTDSGFTPAELAAQHAPDPWIHKIGATIASQSMQADVPQVQAQPAPPRTRF